MTSQIRGWRRITRASRGIRAVLTFAGLATVPLFSSNAHAAGVIQVNSLVDNDVADGACTLREAITARNSNASYHGCSNPGNAGDQISIPAGTILLGSTLPTVTAAVAIYGAGHASTFIDGQKLAAVAALKLSSASDSSLSDLTLQSFSSTALKVTTGASARAYAVKIVNAGDGFASGGCINNAGNLNVYGAQLERCQGFTGGAIWTSGSMVLEASTVLKCTSEHSTIVNSAGSLSVFSTTIGANKTVVGAAAIMNQDSGNTSIESSTLAYNIASSSTNQSNTLYNIAGGQLNLFASVIFATNAGPDCVGTISSGGYNEYVTGRGCSLTATGDRTTTNPQLQPITVAESGFTNLPRAAGGVGRVYVPAANSDLLNQVPGFIACGTEQRGIQRRGANCEIGAAERMVGLMVVGNTTLSTGDQLIKAQLEALGYSFTVVGDTASSAANAADKDLVVLSESVGSSNVNTKFRDVTVPVLVLEPSLFDDMWMTTAANEGAANNTQTYLERGSVSSNLGLLQAQTATTASRLYAWGTPTAGAIVHARSTSTSSQKQLFEYRQGSTMVGGHSAASARVGMFATDDASGVLNATGIRLLQEAAICASSG